MNLTFAANLTKMIDAGLGREAAPPETFVAVGRTTEYTDLGPVAIASFETNVEAPLRALSISMEPIQAGTGDPSPENVRPITGRSAVTVTRAGKNLFGGNALAQAILDSCKSDATQSGNIVTLPLGGGTVNEASENRVQMMKDSFSSGAYTIIIKQVESTRTYSLLSVFYTDGSSIAIGAVHYNSEGKYWKYVSDANKTIQFIRMNRDEGGLHDYDVSKSGVFKGNISYDAFEEYNGQAVTLQLGQTVYGGSLDVASGEMVVDKAFLTIDGTAEWAEHSSGKYYVSNITTGATRSPEYISNQYLFSGEGSSSSSQVITDKRFYGQMSYRRIWVYDSQYTTLEDFKSALSTTPLQIVYPLAQPRTIQLTPEQFTTLIGANNVWSDGGDVSLTYGTVRYTEGY